MGWPRASTEAIRQNVTDAFVRFMIRPEFLLAERFYHQDYLNHEAVSERGHGSQAAVATVRVASFLFWRSAIRD